MRDEKASGGVDHLCTFPSQELSAYVTKYFVVDSRKGTFLDLCVL